MVVVENRPLELQIALAGGKDVHERGEKLKKWCDKECINWKGEPAKKIPEIPQDFHLEQFVAQSKYKEVIATGYNLPIGCDRMEAKVLFADFREHSCFLIGGTTGSGRKNAAKVLMYAATEVGAEVFVFGTKEQNLKAFAEKQSAKYMEQKKDWSNCLMKIVEEQRIQSSYRIFVIEDMYDFMKRIYEEQDEEKGVVQLLGKIIDERNQNQIYWIGICNTKEVRRCMAYPVFTKLTRKKTGLYLGGKLCDQSLFNYENATFEEGQRDNAAGNGYAFLDHEKNVAVPIVIPLVIKE